MLRTSVKNIPKNFRMMSSLKLGQQVMVQRKITPEDLDTFIKLSQDYNPIHRVTQKPLVHGAFLNSLVSGVIGTKLPGFGSIVIEQSLRFPEPCYVNDEVKILTLFLNL